MENNKNKMVITKSLVMALIIPVIHKMKIEFPAYGEQIKIINNIAEDDHFNVNLGNDIIIGFRKSIYGYSWNCSYYGGYCSFVIACDGVRCTIMPSSISTCQTCTDADIIRLRWFFTKLIKRVNEWATDTRFPNDKWAVGINGSPNIGVDETGHFVLNSNIVTQIIDDTTKTTKEKFKEYPIKDIQINEEKKAVTVIFSKKLANDVIDTFAVTSNCTDNDEFDPQVGIAMCIAKAYFGNRTNFVKECDKWINVAKERKFKKEVDAEKKKKNNARQLRIIPMEMKNNKVGMNKMNLNIDRETYDKMSDTEKTSFFKQLHDKHTNDVLARGGGKIIMSLTYGGVPLYEDIEGIIKMIKEED